jgi:hypothetical protein
MKREFTYCFPRWSLVVGLVLGPLMILAGVAGVVVPLSGGTPFTAESLANADQLSMGSLLAYGLGILMLTAAGVVQTAAALRVIQVCGNTNRRIELSPDSLVLPRSFLLADEQVIQYEDIAKIGVYGWLGRRNIVISHSDGRVSILGIAFSSESENEALIVELANRTGLEPTPMLRVPRQFTLSSLLIFTTVLSIVLGLRTSYSRTLGWFDLIVPLGFTLALATIVFIVTRRSWAPRIFVIGFVVGGLIDAMALAVICAVAGVDSSLLDRIWFPLSAVVFRMNYNIHGLGWGTGWIETAVLTCGAAITGVIFGIAAVVFWRYWSRKIRRNQKGATDGHG